MTKTVMDNDEIAAVHTDLKQSHIDDVIKKLLAAHCKART